MKMSHVILTVLLVGALSPTVGGVDKAQEKKTLLAAFTMLESTTQRLAMSRVRTLGIVCEVYATVYDSPYPVGPFAPVDQLTSTFVPELIPEPIVEGPWGDTLYYWSDGLDYLIVAPGKDGQLDRDYAMLLSEVEAEGWDSFQRTVCVGAQDNLHADVVWIDGQFCSWFESDDT